MATALRIRVRPLVIAGVQDLQYYGYQRSSNWHRSPSSTSDIIHNNSSMETEQMQQGCGLLRTLNFRKVSTEDCSNFYGNRSISCGCIPVGSVGGSSRGEYGRQLSPDHGESTATESLFRSVHRKKSFDGSRGSHLGQIPRTASGGHNAAALHQDILKLRDDVRYQRLKERLGVNTKDEEPGGSGLPVRSASGRIFSRPARSASNLSSSLSPSLVTGFPVHHAHTRTSPSHSLPLQNNQPAGGQAGGQPAVEPADYILQGRLMNSPLRTNSTPLERPVRAGPIGVEFDFKPRSFSSPCPARAKLQKEDMKLKELEKKMEFLKVQEKVNSLRCQAVAVQVASEIKLLTSSSTSLEPAGDAPAHHRVSGRLVRSRSSMAGLQRTPSAHGSGIAPHQTTTSTTAGPRESPSGGMARDSPASSTPRDSPAGAQVGAQAASSYARLCSPSLVHPRLSRRHSSGNPDSFALRLLPNRAGLATGSMALPPIPASASFCSTEASSTVDASSSEFSPIPSPRKEHQEPTLPDDRPRNPTVLTPYELYGSCGQPALEVDPARGPGMSERELRGHGTAARNLLLAQHEYLSETDCCTTSSGSEDVLDESHLKDFREFRRQRDIASRPGALTGGNLGPGGETVGPSRGLESYPSVPGRKCQQSPCQLIIGGVGPSMVGSEGARAGSEFGTGFSSDVQCAVPDGLEAGLAAVSYACSGSALLQSEFRSGLTGSSDAGLQVGSGVGRTGSFAWANKVSRFLRDAGKEKVSAFTTSSSPFSSTSSSISSSSNSFLSLEEQRMNAFLSSSLMHALNQDAMGPLIQ